MGYRSIDESGKEVGLYLMSCYNWQRAHTANDGTTPAMAGEKFDLLSEIS